MPSLNFLIKNKLNRQIKCVASVLFFLGHSSITLSNREVIITFTFAVTPTDMGQVQMNNHFQKENAA